MKDLQIVNGVLVECLNKKLTSITIPDGVTKIDCSAFRFCTELTSVVIPNSVTSIGVVAFSDCSNLTSVVIPDSVKSFGYGAFRRCTKMKSIMIPNSVTSIGKSAFDGCTGLTSITIPFVGTHFGYIFGASSYSYNKDYVPSSLKTVVITGGTSIGDSAFSGCTGLTSITIPDSVTSIGYDAFKNCTGLTSITIPDSVTDIDYSAFEGCTGLTSQVKNYKAFVFKTGRLQCRSVSFVPTEWSDQIDNIEICQCGYHYCTNLFDIFNYYCGKIDKDIAIYECEVGDKIYSKEDGDSKHVTNKIKPVKRLYREDIIRILNGQD